MASVETDCLTCGLYNFNARRKEVEYEIEVQLIDVADELKQGFSLLMP